MSTDASIRRVSISEQALAAAQRFVETGEPETNPHAALSTEQEWRLAFDRWCAVLTAPEDCEGTA